MKTVLFTTVLFALSGTQAFAEISISGDARMGVVNGFVHEIGVADQTAFSSRVRVAFTMTGETDGGLAFGAAVRADHAKAAESGKAGSVFLSGSFGKISMGDVDGAAQTAVGQADGVGYTGLGNAEELTFLGGGGTALKGIVPGAATQAVFGTDPTALYEYSAGGVSVFASVSNPAGGFTVPNPPPAADDEVRAKVYSLGLSYAIGAYKVALGYEKSQVNRIVPAAPPENLATEQIVLGGDVALGQVLVKARLAKADLTANGTQLGTFRQQALSATYNADALSVTAFASQKRLRVFSGAVLNKLTTYGLGASYDLGGGATLAGGIAKQIFTPTAGTTRKDTAFDLGLKFAF